ncbi:MAG TPA: hypothetical protein VHG31_07580 [Stellaceae bacterium]|nr:hypothetical protein [Stellaceae bacterium]
MAFDTLSYARRLKQAGVPDIQAEAMADASRELLDSEFATKADITALKSDIALLRSEMAALEQRLRADIAALEQRVMTAIDTMSLRLTVRMGGLIAVGVAALAAIIKL